MEKNQIKINQKIKIAILITIFTIICFYSLNINYGTEITVTNGSNSAQIQNVINTMNNDDVLTFTPGNYNNIQLNVTKAITLNGSGSTINGTGNTINNNNAFNITTNNVKIQNFKIQNYETGIYVTAKNTQITNNTLTNNVYGIFLLSSSNNTLTDNTANNNDIGIYLGISSNNNTLTDNTANNNDNMGICLGISSNNNALTDNTANNNDNMGICLDSLSNNNALTDNTANNNDIGIYLGISSNNTLTGNTVNNNDWGIYLEFSSNNTFIGNSICDNSVAIYLGGTVSGNVFSYNLIAGNTNLLGRYAGTNLLNNNANFNWWGNNSPTGITGITGFEVNNWFKIKLNSTSLFLDRAYGYLVGEIATITWATSGIANLNQRAIIQFIENGKVWHTQYVLLSDGKYKHKFIMAHKTLNVVMTFLGDNNSYGLSDKVPTYVDHVNNSRTFVEIKNMSNLTVGKKGNIDIIVKDYKGNIIPTGKVILKFDNKWSFTIKIKNGVVKFSKVFTKSGNNRLLKITYTKQGNKTASSISTNIVVNKK